MIFKHKTAIEVNIEDLAYSEALKIIEPQYIRSYLASHGWSDKVSTSTYNIFRKESEEVLLPNSNTYRDYVWRIEELIRDLAKMENRNRINILSEIFGFAYKETSWSDIPIEVKNIIRISKVYDYYDSMHRLKKKT